MAIRQMLTGEPRNGGLIAKLPKLEVEAPRQEAAPVAVPEPTFMHGSKEEAEYMASKRAAPRFANPEERRRLETVPFALALTHKALQNHNIIVGCILEPRVQASIAKVMPFVDVELSRLNAELTTGDELTPGRLKN